MRKLLLCLLLLCFSQIVNATAELTFTELKPVYHVGECVFLDLQENLQALSRFHRVDLWVAVQFPGGSLLFMTPLAFDLSPKPQFFRKSLETTKRKHPILDFEVVKGFSGHYVFYAVYAEEGKDPLTDGFFSNLAKVSTELSDEPPLTPVIDCVSVLPAPGELSALASDASVMVTWQSVSNASSYIIYWRASDGSANSLPVTTTSYMHTGLTNGVSYHYWVTAMDSMGVEGIESTRVVAIPKAAAQPPATPTPLAATAGNAQVIFSWQAVTEATSYTVYWQTVDGTVNSLSISDTKFTHNGLVNGNNYTYWVTAVNASGLESPYSSSLSAIPQAAPPPTPVVPPPTTTPVVNPSPTLRYTDNGDGTVTDNRSGLIWLKNANCFGRQNWYTAMESATNLASGQCGLSDGSIAGMWRLPTIDEGKAMIDKNYLFPALSNAAGTGKWTEDEVFSGVELSYYWSSTPEAGNPKYVWYVDLGFGSVNVDVMASTHYVWPVLRCGQSPVAPPTKNPLNPPPSILRYTDNGNGTVTDNRSGLIWLKNANCLGWQNWYVAMQSVANLASGLCGLSDGSVAGMWRLPTIEEWEAMIDKKYELPSLSNAAGTGQWTEGDPFSCMESESYYYWSSTASAHDPDNAWNVHLGYGSVSADGKNFTSYVWPVRGGQ